MHNEKPHIQSVGKIHKVLFDYPVGTGVGTSAVAQDGNGPCIRVLFPKVIVPYPLDVVADKLGGVVAYSHCHIADISGNVIYAVRNKHSVTERTEVMVVRFQNSVRKSLAGSFEVPEQFLLLGIDADDRDTDLLQGLARGCNVLELFVPVLDLPHRYILAEGTLSKTETVKYLSDMISGDFISGLGKFVSDLGLVQGYPYHILILREAGHMGFDDTNYSLRPFRVLGQHCMTSASLPADAPFGESVTGMQFLQSILKSMSADSHIFAKFAVAESLRPETFCSCGKKQSSGSFIQPGHIRLFTWREYFWRSFRMHPYITWLFYKDTKFSPDLLYYAIDNQIIKQIFYAFSLNHNQATFDSDFRGQNCHLKAA